MQQICSCKLHLRDVNKVTAFTFSGRHPPDRNCKSKLLRNVAPDNIL